MPTCACLVLLFSEATPAREIPRRSNTRSLNKKAQWRTQASERKSKGKNKSSKEAHYLQPRISQAHLQSIHQEHTLEQNPSVPFRIRAAAPGKAQRKSHCSARSSGFEHLCPCRRETPPRALRCNELAGLRAPTEETIARGSSCGCRHSVRHITVLELRAST